MSLALGIKGSSSCTVTKDLTAKSLRSGGLDVFATPIMVALMEEASLVSVRPLSRIHISNELCPQMVPQARVELATHGFSVRCSTN